ncbi:MAG: UDP-N-acetylmuramate--L-alanine ligase [Actinobacteria bacterium]|nr:UDP-N-acetylmuramate--L-alanine ligase [Actinomycetota bacterium]
MGFEIQPPDWLQKYFEWHSSIKERKASRVAELGHVFIVGIGGAGMSGIARILIAQGAQVSGSDAKESRRLDALRALGVEVFIGHSGDWLKGVDTLVFSSAIPATNPERLAAAELGVTEMNRAEALVAVMAGSRGVAVAGTHGKTTTTSMLTVALQSCGADPSFAIGSELNETGANAHLGSGEIFVVEADESDGAFLHLDAVAGIVTNVEADHLNHWGSLEAIEQGFLDFAKNIHARSGFLTACIDDAGGRKLALHAKAIGVDVRTYGTAPDADYRLVKPTLVGRGWEYTVEHQGLSYGPVRLQVPGEHNALNALAAFVTGLGLGFAADELITGLAEFTGTRRRFDFKGEADGVRVFDDYAHHPTEIAATLRAARDVVGQGRLVVAFQAHHYYRTAMFLTEFGQALGLADEVIVLEVYAPGETPIPGASGQTMAANVPLPAQQVHFEPSWSAVAGELAARAKPGDLVMTLGAGDIGLLGAEVLEILTRRT